MKKLAKYTIAVLGLVLTLGLTPAANAYTYTFTIDMRMGYTSGEVFELQKALNTTACRVATTGAGAPGFESSYFGSLTAAAVRCFQASRGLTADAIVGPMTRAALNALPGGPVTNLPPGCLPGNLFSSTTGQSCIPGTPGPLPPGCPSTVGYSPLTGVKCDSLINPPPNNNDDNLQGGAGFIESIDLITSIDDEEVGEGDDNVKVLGAEIEADNSSDIKITAVRLGFDRGGDEASDPSNDLEDYASDVTVWCGTDKVATMNSNTFGNNDFTTSVTLTDSCIIRRGDTENLYVAVSGVNNLSSDDEDEEWTVDVESIRFLDAQGATTTEEPNDVGDALVRSFSFVTDSDNDDDDDDDDSNGVELSLTESSDNPDVDDEVETDDDVLLLAGTLEASDSDIEIKEMTVTIDATGGDPSDAASRFSLWIDGEEVQTIDANDCEADADCDEGDENGDAVYVFDDIDFTIDEGEEVDIEVRADVMDTTDDDVSLTASIDNDDTVAEDESGDEIDESDLSGTITGNKQTFNSTP